MVDYIAVSPELFSNIIDMKIKNFNPLLSDVHKPIELHIHCTFFACTISDVEFEKGSNFIANKCKWEPGISDSCVTNINTDQLGVMEVELNQLLNSASVDQSCIDRCNGTFCDIIKLEAQGPGASLIAFN